MPETILSSVQEFGRQLTPGARVLDVGCGERPYENFFSHCTYLGIDVETSGRHIQYKKPDRFFDGKAIPYEDAHFDAVICTEVLEHSMEPDILVGEMNRVLKPKGLLFVTVPFIWGEHEPPYDFRRYSTFGIKKLMAQAKFNLVHLGKLTRGVGAIEKLVNSEINNYVVNVSPGQPITLLRKVMRVGAKMLVRLTWPLQLKLWKVLYQFDRIYIDTVAIAAKE